jgi:hypothetical protein
MSLKAAAGVARVRCLPSSDGLTPFGFFIGRQPKRFHVSVTDVATDGT